MRVCACVIVSGPLGAKLSFQVGVSSLGLESDIGFV